MAPLRVALIGHSGAGKSACLGRLGIAGPMGDMDALGFKLSKSDDEALRVLDRALNWLASGDAPRVVTVRNDEKMLYAMIKAKLRGHRAEQFRHFFLLYLHVPKDQLSEHLKERDDTDAIDYTLSNYDRFHDLYIELADETIECANKSVETVAAEVNMIACGLGGKNL